MGSSKGSDSCHECGSDLLLYKCKYCGMVFCERHRRPQDHKCPGLSSYKQQVEAGTVEKPGMAAASSQAEVPDNQSTSRPAIIRWSFLGIKVLALAIIAMSLLAALILLIGYIDARTTITYVTLPVQNTTGVQVVLANNRSAVDPTYDELVRFLKADDTSSMKYVSPGWTCADFARRLHDNAEAQGIKAGFVGVEFYGDSIDYSIYDDGSGNLLSPPGAPDMGHGLNIFNTVDKGLVYVDASSIYEGSTGDRIAYVVEGREFNEIDLDYAAGTDYSFYSGYRQKYLDYIHELKEYNRLAKNYNQGIAEPGMELNQMALVLKSRSDVLNAKKAEIGPFYYPSGTVKKINVYW
ncbi:AN1-type zinc finger domain-containing protein [Methanocella arvoryzae]|uniref:AN1-type domain-containing protein n=1 Tax=Methanocella arvoryzae (strain DSM 22066 / NBRC 105507 / MRE50) TaxID=351160 RepID=Q0W472_METAR|nr:AN1-type zinc finger protein [Methanocella arvoryzae]CAJ36821.1 hypothetical protein RCIX1572 [Methanocella arvoryzae MRE50]